MDYTLICIDIDGTLINDSGQISEHNKRAIYEAQQKGCIVTLVTGRRFLSALPYARQLGLNLPIICLDGGLVIDPMTAKHFHVAYMEPSYVLKVAQAWHQLRAPILVYRHASHPPDVYLQNPGDHVAVQNYIKANGSRVVVVEDLYQHVSWQPLRILTMGDKEVVERCYSDFLELYQDSQVRTLLTGDELRYLQVTSAQATKSNGLRWLSKYYGIGQERIMAIGDGLNDLDMLEWAGLGVAMDNAHPQTKALADYVTTDNNNDGVAQALKTFVL